MAQQVLHSIIGPSVQVPPDLTGKIAIVTGGALGIGYEISLAFAKANARVIMINRKEEQGEEAIRKIKDAKADAKIEWTPCDLGNLKETKEVFDRLAKDLDRLDLLICSAGINANFYGLDSDGIDRHFGVNWLGHFLAVNRLYPLLRKTSTLSGSSTFPPRIVFESSEMHRTAPNNMHYGSLEEINNDQLSPIELYGRTKAAMIIGSKYGIFEKVIKPNHDNIYVYAVHPGAVNTDMQEQWKDAYPGIVGEITTAVMYVAGRSPEQGAYSAIYAATSNEPIEQKKNGWYFSDPATDGKETKQCSDPALGAALWDLSHRIVKEKLGDDVGSNWSK